MLLRNNGINCERDRHRGRERESRLQLLTKANAARGYKPFEYIELRDKVPMNIHQRKNGGLRKRKLFKLLLLQIVLGIITCFLQRCSVMLGARVFQSKQLLGS